MIGDEAYCSPTGRSAIRTGALVTTAVMAFDEDGSQTPVAPTYGTEPWQCLWATSGTGDVFVLAVPGIMVASISFQFAPLGSRVRGSGPNAQGINDKSCTRLYRNRQSTKPK